MYNNVYDEYSCPYYSNTQMHNPHTMHNTYSPCQCPHCNMHYWDFLKQFSNQNIPFANQADNASIQLKDYGPEPFVINIDKAAKQNNNYRIALWTGDHLQLTLMSINVGEDIGLEIHPNLNQFIHIEEGQGLVKMGDNRNNLDFQRNVRDGFAIIVPASKWHNVINTGQKPLKLYSIYAPPNHPYGTVQETKAAAQASKMAKY